MDVLLQILMWVGLAFLAGFIGQFGKSLTLRMLERRRAGAARQTEAADLSAAKEEHKLEKKLAKQELKHRKKTKAPGKEGQD